MNILKSIVGAVVGFSVSNTISGCIEALIGGNSNKITKITTMVGSAVIGAMVADRATNYVNRQIEETIEQIKMVDTGTKEAN